MRDQLAHCSARVARTRGLIQFNIELLKEPDPLAYLQVGNAMAHRIVQQLEDVDREGWSAEERSAGTGMAGGISEFALTLDTRELQRVIGGTDFSQMKRRLLIFDVMRLCSHQFSIFSPCSTTLHSLRVPRREQLHLTRMAMCLH